MAYNAAAGVVQTSHKLPLPQWGFLTWAAKPSVRKSPDPAISESLKASVTSAQAFRPPNDYAYAPIKVPFGFVVIVFSWTMATSFG
jgi:hypothetical protein